jgi:hypothetical protein
MPKPSHPCAARRTPRKTESTRGEFVLASELIKKSLSQKPAMPICKNGREMRSKEFMWTTPPDDDNTIDKLESDTKPTKHNDESQDAEFFEKLLELQLEYDIILKRTSSLDIETKKFGDKLEALIRLHTNAKVMYSDIEEEEEVEE